ncbi:MFS transporter [Sphingomonas lycopersici]|uniref:Glycoside-pentoside-hexuronide (GPH):cation symporter n=1 Tax=Sphingomonas lycopersici TaxID=2951807 RepID=A0AA42CR70_9SPHN|nr:glycoside-pentoside-hexuronide (GPH):cation symporter [Sphingomonas lycopersici]MCW6536420.1 glycoside-pentoside-hexuronide (GPH):cation symporter [Sphingomonas lycopersici]
MNRLGWRRMLAFASGDFAFNLYWQSVSLYLLFYYTEAMGISAATAGFIYMIASICDGLVDPLIGYAADRTRTRWGRYRPWLLVGAVPLAIGFGLLYFHPPLEGGALVVAVAAAHLLFRSLYAAVNVPYAALTASITRSAAERATIAGMRMVFGTGAYVVVALSTQPIARVVTGSRDGAFGFFVAACLFALIAAPIMLMVFAISREREAGPAPAGRSARHWQAVFRNRAFWTLVLAGTVLIACYTIYAKSVLYYFKYVLRDESGAPTALALAGAIGLVVVPLWMLVERRLGKRAIWFVSCAIFGVGLIAFALFPPGAGWPIRLFLIAMQAGFLGINFAYWGLLPDTVEYGEWRSGERAEGLVFGLALLFQKIALGLGAGAFGLALGRIGYVANQPQTPAALAGMRAVMVLLPLTGAALSALILWFNPLRRGVHDTIVAEIAARGAAQGTARC